METSPSNFQGAVNPETIDEIFQALSNATRRHLLAYLDDREEHVTSDELVEYLSATTESRDEPASSADPNGIAVRLHHQHLPKLEASGLVEIAEKPTGRMVRGTDLLDQVATEWGSFYPEM